MHAAVKNKVSCIEKFMFLNTTVTQARIIELYPLLVSGKLVMLFLNFLETPSILSLKTDSIYLCY